MESLVLGASQRLLGQMQQQALYARLGPFLGGGSKAGAYQTALRVRSFKKGKRTAAHVVTQQSLAQVHIGSIMMAQTESDLQDSVSCL